MKLSEASAHIAAEMQRLIKRDTALGHAPEAMAAMWAFEVSAAVGFPVIVIPTPAGMVAYPVPQQGHIDEMKRMSEPNGGDPG